MFGNIHDFISATALRHMSQKKNIELLGALPDRLLAEQMEQLNLKGGEKRLN